MDVNRLATHSLQDRRLLQILSAALEAVDPRPAVQRHLARHPLPAARRTFGLAIGKAALPMLEALAGIHPLQSGLAVTKHASGLTEGRFAVMEAGHPVPDARSLQAGRRVLEFAAQADEEALLVCLISGGGSALVAAPPESVTLGDLQALTSELLGSGARIDEVNTLRRHLDRVKGGGLLRVANKARVVSLILSDVVGNSLTAIASGPTAPDPTTRADALGVLHKYGLVDRLPRAIVRALESAPETLKVGEPVFERVENVIIGDVSLAAQAAQTLARDLGFEAQILSTEVQGEARLVGLEMARTLRRACARRPRPFCLIAGGETTVTLQSSSAPGRGGRNQELALAAVDEIDGLTDAFLITLATDGEDGPTDAAGAAVTGSTRRRAAALGLDPAEFLARNDSYPFLEALGDLLKPGPTGTNVNDLVILAGL